MALAGCVMITNPSYSTELNAANLVYERVGDRLAWQIYRSAAASCRQTGTGTGPTAAPTGSVTESFDPRERAFMLHPMLHVWSKAVTALTAETLLELFQEAVDLRPPDSRTGIWRTNPAASSSPPAPPPPDGPGGEDAAGGREPKVPIALSGGPAGSASW